MYNEYEIRPMPLSLPFCRKRVELFLAKNGLRLDDVDYYACVFRLGDDEEILAGGGLKGKVIKCIAVNDTLREEGFSSRLISHLMSEANQQGHDSVSVFTKPENRDIFEAMGFQLIAKAPRAILLEYGNGLRDYCHYLSGQRRLGRSGVIVMNANPFTLGHRYLIEEAARQVEWLHIIIVREDLSLFSYAERLEMVRRGTTDLLNVNVIEGSDYAVSATTFPTYFLKQLSDATDTQILLDLDLFAHFIAPHLGISVRFVGTEPTDLTTKRYNKLMQVTLKEYGYDVIEVSRKCCDDGKAVSASRVRALLSEGDYTAASMLCPITTQPFLLSQLATQALQQELDTTPKPGLVDRHDNGAHSDMDYALMQKSIEVLHPWLTRIALIATDSNTDIPQKIQNLGIEAEKAMLEATNGINTHRGALFSMGLMLAAAAYELATEEQGHTLREEILQQHVALLAQHFKSPNNTHGAAIRPEGSTRGAVASAQEGYKALFGSWLLYYQQHRDDPYINHKLLLLIISELDDTNIVFRKGEEKAQEIKALAREALSNFSTDKLEELNHLLIKEHISPGGAADMLALTLFVSALTSKTML